jgi:predicted amidophosphoribosyltransferase
MNCPSCQKNLQGDFKFCPHCGAQTTQNLICPSCTKQTEPAWVTCPYCGSGLRGQANQQIPAQPPQPPQPPPQYQQPPYQHGYNYGSSSKKRKKRGFLGGMFSS